MRSKFLLGILLFLASFQGYNAMAQCPTNPATIITVSNANCNSGSDGSILYEFTDGDLNHDVDGVWQYIMYTFPELQIVTPPFGTAVISNPAPEQVLVSGLAAENYLLWVEHIPTGCTVQIAPLGGEPLTEPTAIDFTGTTTLPDCDNLGSGTITIQANGGVPPYVIKYVSGPTSFANGNIAADGGTVNFGSVKAGTYEVQIEDANLCTVNKNDIVVVAGPEAGTIGTHAYCSTGGATNLFADLGGTPDAGGIWTGPSALAGGSLGTFDPATNTAGIYTYTVSGAPCADAVQTVTVTITLTPDAGTIGSHLYCSTDASTNLFADLGGTPDAGGVWTGPSALAGGSLGTFDPATNTAGVYTYTVSGAPCADAVQTVTVTITPAPDAGTIGTHLYCSTGTSTNLFADLGGTPDAGGVWTGPSALAGGSLGTFDPATNTAGVYIYTVSGVAPCADAIQSVTVTVNTAPNAGTATAQTTCNNINNFDLFTGLAGNDAGGTWVDDDATGALIANIFDATLVIPGSYDFTYMVILAGCTDDTETVTVTVNTTPNAGTAAAQTTCSNINNFDLFSGLAGNDAGGTWSDDDATGALTANLFDATAVVPGSYDFTYTVSVVGCIDDIETVTVTVNTAPSAGTATIQTICNDILNFDLFTGLAGNDAGGIWVDDDATGALTANIFDATLVIPGSYDFTYTVSVVGCTDATETVTITVNKMPDASIAGSPSVCANTTESYAVPAGETSYVWSITGGDGIISSGAGTNTIMVDWGVLGGDLSVIVTGSAPTSCVSISTLAVGVFSTIPALTDQSTDLCQNSGLFPVMIASPLPGATVNWYLGTAIPANLVSTGVSFTPTAAELDLATSGATIFTYNQDIGCLLSPDASYTVNVLPQPNAGTDKTIAICTSFPPVDLLAQLGGTPDAGGNWNDDDMSMALSSNMFDPSLSGVGTFNFTYTVDGSGVCVAEFATAVVTVSVNTISLPPVTDGISVLACTYGMVPSLSVPGPGVVWYSDEALTNVVATSSSFDPVDGIDIDMKMIGTTSFYVTQNNGCGESAAAQVDIELEGVMADLGEVRDTYPEQDIGAIEVLNISSKSPPFEVMLEDFAMNTIKDWVTLEEDRLGNYSYIFTQLAAGIYVVLVKDAKGCVLPISQTITLKTGIFIPNVITPNGDGYNEYFKVLNKTANTKIVISNRWGNKVFESDDYQNNWDGENLPEGVYFYIIKMDGVVYRGNVEVWRNDGAGSN